MNPSTDRIELLPKELLDLPEKSLKDCMPPVDIEKKIEELQKEREEFLVREKQREAGKVVEIPKAPYLQLFILPPVGKRVASFAGYHWKIKSINPTTQEVTLEPDCKTSQGERLWADMQKRPEKYGLAIPLSSNRGK